MSEGDKDLIFTGCANGLNPLDPLGPIFSLIDDKGALSSQKTLKRETKQVSSWQPRPRWSAGTLPVHLCRHVHTAKCWLQQEYRHPQYPRDLRADHKVKTVWLCDLYLLSGKFRVGQGG